MKKNYCFIFILIILFTNSIAAKENELNRKKEKYPEYNNSLFFKPDKAAIRWVNKVYSSLTLKEKVGQLVVPFTTTYYQSDDSRSFKDLVKQIKKNKVGGFIFSLGDVYSIANLANALQKYSKVPLLMSADFEKGVAMRIERATLFPNNMALGATYDESLAFKMGKIVGREGRALGVHQNYAPDMDVNNNPKNPIINVRSFGEDPYLVAKMGNAFIKGLHTGGMVSTVKHFPGHGDTEVDSHSDLPVLNFSRSRLDSLELIPFKSAIENLVPSVMIAHLSIPVLDNTKNLPGSLSYKVITDLLKNELKFRGLVVTDGMEMRGISKNFSTSEATIKAIQAGEDIVLMPPNPEIAVKAIYNAVRKGDISQKRIEESVKKILMLKYCLGLNKNKFTNLGAISKIVNSDLNNDIAQEIARKAVTVLKNDSILPIQRNGIPRVVCISVSDNSDPTTGAIFEKGFSGRYRNAEFYRIDSRATDVEFEKIYNRAKDADMLILPVYLKVRSYSGSVSFNKQQKKYIDSLYNLKKKTFMLSFGNPYVISDYPQSSAYLTTYGDAPVSIEAGIESIFGEIPITGKLPINIPGYAKIGEGLQLPKCALENSSPSGLELSEDSFEPVDDMVNKAIEDSIFPGATLLIAKDGKIFYDKAFGFYTYESDSKQMTNRTMFDLASVSKVIGTTNAAMKLIDEKKLDLEAPVSIYLPKFSSNGKDKIRIKNLLYHNSGLPPFKLFYKMCSSPEAIMDSIYACELLFNPGDSSLYSDIGMITLGKVIEKISGQSLDVYLKENFFRPLGLTSTMYNPTASMIENCAPTEIDNYWRMKLVQGKVHDENADALGGVAGHAGLFSTSGDLAVILQMLLNKGEYAGKRYLSPAIIEKFLTRENTKSSRALGWGLKAVDGFTSAGKKFSKESFGHLGFTGTSVWVDPERNLFVILLTNRVYPTRTNNKLNDFRPVLNDKIIECLENLKNKISE
jgi:beta-N-acetylhexosaminidase